MIILNKLAGKCLENAINSDRVTEQSGPRAYLMQTTVHLGLVYDKTSFKSEELPRWSEREVAAADTICWAVAFLKKIKCKNIEQLLYDMIEYRSAHPDRKQKKET